MIFRRSRSQIFFKIGALKKIRNIHSRAPVLALADLHLQNNYRDCFNIFAAANTFFQVNLVFIADRSTGFCSELLLLRKHDLNLRSSNWSSSVKKVFLEILQISQENTCVEVSF